MGVVRINANGDYFYIRESLADQLGTLYSVHDRHFNVHHDNVYRLFFQNFQRLLTVASLCDALDIRYIVQKKLDAFGDNHMIICEQKVDHEDKASEGRSYHPKNS